MRLANNHRSNAHDVVSAILDWYSTAGAWRRILRCGCAPDAMSDVTKEGPVSALPTKHWKARTMHRGGAALAAAALIGASVAGCAVPNEVIPTHEKTPVVSFAQAETIEHEIVTQLYAYALRNAGYRVEVLAPQGDTAAAFSAVADGEATFTVAYTGDVVMRANAAGSDTAPVSAAQAYSTMLEVLPDGMEAGSASAAQDKPAVVVSENTSRTWGLRTMSDLAGRCGDLRLATTPAVALEDDIRSALRGYDCEFASVDNAFARPGDVTEALRAGTAGAGLVYSTDPVLFPGDMVTLADDQERVAAQSLVPVFAADSVNTEQRTLIEKVSRALTTEEVASLNAAVESGRVPVVGAVVYWLDQHGL